MKFVREWVNVSNLRGQYKRHNFIDKQFLYCYVLELL